MAPRSGTQTRSAPPPSLRAKGEGPRHREAAPVGRAAGPSAVPIFGKPRGARDPAIDIGSGVLA